MINKYARQQILPNVGELGQEKISSARVLVVGAGGLGCPVLQYLTGAGVGTISIIDPDTISESNLQRQVLYDRTDLGNFKVLVAEKKLKDLNELVKIKPIVDRFDFHNALELVQNHDLVVDCTDNFDTRYLINDASVISKKPFVSGSLFQFEGQVSVFNHQGGPTYRCLYPKKPDQNSIPTCAEIGVWGPLVGMVGCVQASEVLKLIVGIGDLLIGKLWIYSSLSNCSQMISFVLEPKNLTIYRLTPSQNPPRLNSISYNELEELKLDHEEILLIDIRSKNDHLMGNLGGICIPETEIFTKISSLNAHKKVVIYCQSGNKSSLLVQKIRENHPEIDCWSLEGGLNNT